MPYVRVVLDTNILVGALITKDTPPDRLYQAWLRGEFELVTSEFQLAELADVLARPRLQKFINQEEAAAILVELESIALVVTTVREVGYSQDRDDNWILAAAIEAQAELIVSGDKPDMLALREVRGIPIVTARQALEYLGVLD